MCACICILVGICVCLGGSTVRGYSRFSVLCSLLSTLYTLLFTLESGTHDSERKDLKYIEIRWYLGVCFVLSFVWRGVSWCGWYMVDGVYYGGYHVIGMTRQDKERCDEVR